jgi:L-ascorbate metabolism protein UlaG (beta-lactamase superfamily)
MICVAGGERIELGPGVFVSVYPSQHSCIWTGTHGAGSGEVCIGDLGVTWPERSARMKELHGRMATSLDRSSIEHLLSASGAHSDRGDGGTLLYLFELPQGSLLFQDTAGHWRSILGGLRPDVAILAAAGRANIDGDPVQGSLADFVAEEARTLAARRVVLAHHDDWLPGFAAAPDWSPFVRPLRNELPVLSSSSPATLAELP